MHASAAPKKILGAPMRSLRRRLFAQAITEIVARYNAGENTPALSREYGISKTGLLQLLRVEGVTLRRRPMTHEDIEWAVRLYKSGLTIDEVVKQVGYSSSTIQRALHQKGVMMRANCIRT